MNNNPKRHGLDQSGFLSGGFISAILLATYPITVLEWLLWMPVYTALIGLPIAALVYGAKDAAFREGFQQGRESERTNRTELGQDPLF
jgi:hypothetical protein